MKVVPHKIWFGFMLSFMISFQLMSQTYYSNWRERGASNKLDSVLIEINNNKVTISIPKDNGSILVFEGRMLTDFNDNQQELKAYVKGISDNTKVSPEYLQTLKAHAPRLLCFIKDGDDTIDFGDNKVEFWTPEKSPESPNAIEYSYIKKNHFIVDRTWVTKSKAFTMRQLIDDDSYYATGLVCGLTDGFLEDVNMLISIAEVIDQNTLFFIGDMQLYDEYMGAPDESFRNEYGFLLPSEFSAEATEARAKQRKIAIMIGEYLSDTDKLKELGGIMYTELSQMLSEWFNETIGNNTPAIAGYQHGKILYGIITMFIGVKEVSVMLQGGREGLKMLKLIKNMACFTGDTPVHTIHGAIPISELSLGIEQFETLDTN